MITFGYEAARGFLRPLPRDIFGDVLAGGVQVQCDFLGYVYGMSAREIADALIAAALPGKWWRTLDLGLRIVK